MAPDIHILLCEHVVGRLVKLCRAIGTSVVAPYSMVSPTTFASDNRVTGLRYLQLKVDALKAQFIMLALSSYQHTFVWRWRSGHEPRQDEKHESKG